MRIGSVILVIWLVIGAIAAGQRGDYHHLDNCTGVATAGVTIAAGLLNYLHVNPHINCSTPQPSK